MVRKGALKLKAQIFCGDQPAIGPGKADLLEAIDREGSIAAAGRAMGMSYRRTWMLVDTMNRSWKDKLVETTKGGGPSKGARLTDCGRTVLDAYRALEQQLAEAAEGRLRTLTALLLDTPREASEPARAASTPAATN
ncbi:winged helix-turn-helix domain-containing protein [Sphingobium lignivorans]|uniref:Molybdate transport system regulatory protein n=1 Tax=Sphingobium lignivorans TaxID=2735886 RepID=A0ABR6NGY8_9SPHN|nr:LysR family transcriptional regulator [Sphingobium lignivorans]MBB5986547.1 molybdate transport system regulatory protein [Sphingobium lignivorans]